MVYVGYSRQFTAWLFRYCSVLRDKSQLGRRRPASHRDAAVTSGFSACTCHVISDNTLISVAWRFTAWHITNMPWSQSVDTIFCQVTRLYVQLKEAGTHESANTHAGTVFCASGPWPLTFWPENKWVSRTHGGTFLCHVWWSCLQRFLDIVPKNRQTDRRTNSRTSLKTPPRDYRRRG